jgi:four helix bundle protein
MPWRRQTNFVSNLVPNLVNCQAVHYPISDIMFSHEKLDVYKDILHFVAQAEDAVVDWDKKFCVADHLTRAAESIVLNLAYACRERSLAAKHSSIDYSLGSVLESAACMDVASVVGFFTCDEARKRKEDLVSVFRRLVRLRESWGKQVIKEEGGMYSAGCGESTPLFHHERLDVYRLSLQVFNELASVGLFERLQVSMFRRVDQAATSIVLNIAEGNGRYARLDHKRFLTIANRSTTKLAALADVCTAKGIWTFSDISRIKQTLRTIDRMTAGMLNC